MVPAMFNVAALSHITMTAEARQKVTGAIANTQAVVLVGCACRWIQSVYVPPQFRQQGHFKSELCVLAVAAPYDCMTFFPANNASIPSSTRKTGYAKPTQGVVASTCV
jgi:hypothetical protein